MHKLLFPFFIVAFSLVSGHAWADKPQAPKTVPGATAVTAEQLIDLVQSVPDLVIIDARRVEEYKKGHIDGAYNLLNTVMNEENLASLVSSKETPVLFYCNGPRCLRSSKASKKALSWGYTRVYWFRGGWREWSDKQYPISF